MSGKNIIDDLKKAMHLVETMKLPDVVLLRPNLYEDLKRRGDVEGVTLVPCHFVEEGTAYVITDERLKKDVLKAYRSRRKEFDNEKTMEKD